MTGRALTRRSFVKLLGVAPFAGMAGVGPAGPRPMFQISLAQWSLHRTLYAGKLDTLGFPRIARETFGVGAIEYVSSFFPKDVTDAWLAELNQRSKDHGVESLLIMVDGAGALGDADKAARLRAVEAHRPWLDRAKALGCHAIRVNAQSSGTRAEQHDRAVDGLRRLAELGDAMKLDVIVENHGGLSSDGAWLSGVLSAVDHPRCGALPDFGNFRVSDGVTYDRYRGVKELMPFARAVSAKSHAFDGDGNETGTDYRRMMRIVLDAGYRGWVGIEYEGSELPEIEGVKATKRLLEHVRRALAEEYIEPAATRPDTRRPAAPE